MSITAFRKIQVAQETTKGGGNAASKRWIGTLAVTPRVDWHRPVDERGSLAEFKRAVAVGQGAAIRYEGDATYEQIIDFLAMSVKGVSGPTTNNGAQLWSFVPSLTSKNNQKSYAVEYGDDTVVFRANYALVERLELPIALGQPVSLRADMFARLPSTISFTTGISDPSVSEIVANKAKVYIDTTWSNLGNTQKASLMLGGTVRLTPGLAPIKYADGSLDFSSFVEQRRHLELELELAVSTDALEEYKKFTTGTRRAVRIQFDGPSVGSTARYFRINMTGRYTEAPEFFGERDGLNMIRMRLQSHEDADGNEFSFAVQNGTTGY